MSDVRQLPAPRRKIQRWGALKQERSSWINRYREISENLLPYAGRFFSTDRNRGDITFNSIYDSSATWALDVLAAGMMAGMTSPARPWFRLATPDPDLNELDPVKMWLADVTELMRDIFNKSNTYRALHGMYEELGSFCTGVTIVEPDFETVIWHTPLTAGEYALAQDARGRVTTIYREFEMTVEEMVGEFGHANVSSTVRDLYDRGAYDKWVPVLHAIEPRKDRDYAKRDAKNLPIASCYMELGRADGDEKFLRESGYRRFPALAARWAVKGRDIYGHGPGFKALGDIRQLQHEQLRKAQGIDFQANPPLQVPTALKGNEVNTLPGGVTYYDPASPHGGIKSLFEVQLDLNHLLADVQDVRQRINRAFYADLFLMLANDSRSGITAREIAERYEEKLLMLGPVLERLHDEMLSPLVDMTFERIMQAGIMPPPPPELQGSELKIEFISTLAQAQRAVGLGSVDRLIGLVAMVAPVKPSVLHKVDFDQVIDKYADMLGVDPSIIVADEQVAIIREQEAQQQAAAQQAAMVQPMADAAGKLAGAKTDEKNALTDVLKQFTGYSTGQ